MSDSIIEKELTQGVVPIGTPKAYQYDAALVEAAKASVRQGLTDANTILTAIRNEYGYPFTASSADAMTDQTKIYVYTGTTTASLTQGHWYYYNGSAWTDGGSYNSYALETDPTLTISGAAADAKVTGKLLGVKQGYVLYNLATSTDFPYAVDVYTNKNVNAGSGGTRLRLENLNNYVSYCFIPTKQVVLYCNNSASTYYGIGYIESPVQSAWATDSQGVMYKDGVNSTRYRTSDNNLPITENDALTLPAGTQIVVTVKSGESPLILLQETVTEDKTTENYIDVEVHNGYFYHYHRTPSGKFLRYKFNHFVDADTNADGWVQRNVDLLYSDKSTVLFPVVANGEWEMAIKIKDRSDFIGCQNHGSEISTIVDFYADGIGFTPTNGTNFRCKEIKVNQKSTMYDPNDETTIVGYHYKTHIITAEGITIKQRIEWVADLTLMTSYVLMMPAVRGNDSTSVTQVTDHAYDDHNMVESDVSTTTFVPTDIMNYVNRGNTVCLYGSTSKIAITSICDIDNRPDSSIAYLSNAVYYNKWYYSYCGDNYTVNNGDVWSWKSKYIITYGE